MWLFSSLPDFSLLLRLLVSEALAGGRSVFVDRLVSRSTKTLVKSDSLFFERVNLGGKSAAAETDGVVGYNQGGDAGDEMQDMVACVIMDKAQEEAVVSTV
jgi:hypothetical protein